MKWTEWILGILGIWVIIVPYLMSESALKIVLVITGLVIAILGFWAAATRGGAMKS